MPRVILTIGAVVTVLHLAATPARAASITYVYTGELFNFCGFLCPENAPEDPFGTDFLRATLTFSDPLAAGLTFLDDPASTFTGWSLENYIGGIDLSSTIGATPGNAQLPLLLATDGRGNLVAWQMAAFSGSGGIPNPAILGCDASDCGASTYSFGWRYSQRARIR